MSDDRPTIGTVKATIGPWIKTPDSVWDEPPPHRPLFQPPGIPMTLGVIWADREQTIPLAVRDYDGCEALISDVSAV